MKLNAEDPSGGHESMNQPFSLTYDLLIVLLVLFVVALLALAALYVLRRRRKNLKQAHLPLYNDEGLKPKPSKHRRAPSSLIIPANGYSLSFPNMFDDYEKRDSPKSASRPPSYPLPEIRIHFSEDSSLVGNQQNSRVVVVRIDESSAGLEPVEEQLPSYKQDDSSERFQSLDLERLGGLQEKEFLPK